MNDVHIFVDLDGCIAHLDKKVDEILGPGFTRPTGHIPWDVFYEKCPTAFFDLEKMPDADLLMDYLAPYSPKILTASPNRWNWPFCAENKATWARKHFGGEDLVVIVVPHAQYKQMYCLGPNFVLIDDSAMNIDQWKSRGGIGILHVNTLDTIRQLQDVGISPSFMV